MATLSTAAAVRSPGREHAEGVEPAWDRVQEERVGTGASVSHGFLLIRRRPFQVHSLFLSLFPFFFPRLFSLVYYHN